MYGMFVREGYLETLRADMIAVLVIHEKHIGPCGWIGPSVMCLYGSSLIVFEKWGAMENLSNESLISAVFEHTYTYTPTYVFPIVPKVQVGQRNTNFHVDQC